MESKIKQKVLKGCGEYELGQNPCQKGYLCDDCELELKGWNDCLTEVGKVIDSFDFMKEVNYICEGMKCPSNNKLHTNEDINRWVRTQQKKKIGIRNMKEVSKK